MLRQDLPLLIGSFRQYRLFCAPRAAQCGY